MTPIINPMWFYWIGVVDGLRSFLSEGILIIGTILLFVGVFCYWHLTETFYRTDDGFKEGMKKLRKYLTTATVTILILLTLGIFIPSQTTLIQMMTASYATSDNVKAVIEAVQETADSIIDKLNEE